MFPSIIKEQLTNIFVYTYNEMIWYMVSNDWNDYQDQDN